MAAVIQDQGTRYGNWSWSLRFSHTAMLRLQMTCGSLQGVASQLMGLMGPDGLTGDLPGRTGALLVWAGESWRSPKLTVEKVERRLAAMHPFERNNLITWAVADFLTACLSMMEAQLQKQLPTQVDDDE